MARLTLLGAAITTLACTLPIGCQTTDYQTKKDSQPTISAYSRQKFGDEVFISGKHIGPFPSMANQSGVTLEKDKASLHAWRWSVFDNHGKAATVEHGLTGKLNLTDSVSAKASIQDWPVFGHTTIGLLATTYQNQGFYTELMTLNDLSDGGTLYGLIVSQELTSFHNLTGRIKTAYSDGFLGGNVTRGWKHITPGLCADLGSIGPLEFSGNINYQHGLDDTTNSMIYGAINMEIKTPKVKLGGKE